MAEKISTEIQIEKKIAENEKNFANQSLKEQKQAKAKNEVKLFFSNEKKLKKIFFSIFKFISIIYDICYF